MIFNIFWDAPYGYSLTMRCSTTQSTIHHDALALQRDLAKLGQWAEYWQMYFNPSKYYKMHVYRKMLIRWNSHVVRIVKKASSSVFWCH